MTPKDELQTNLAEITTLIYGNWGTQIVYVFAELGIADVLVTGPKDISQLAEILTVHSDYLKRYLRCTLSLGFVFYNAQTGLYHLLDKGKLLSSTHPNSKREEARLNGADYRYQPWGNLLNILKYGMKDEFSATYKQRGSFKYLKDKPQQLNTIHKAMTSISRNENVPIVNDYDFSRFSHVLDVGSGEGGFIKAILDKNPNLHGYMFDLFDFPPENENIYRGRLTHIQGDFFNEIPDVADLYTMKNVIHNWEECDAIKILEKTRDAMLSQKGNKAHPVQKRLLIIENLLNDTNHNNVGNWMDLNFMVLLNGAERTLEEYEILSAKCDLKLKNSFKTTVGRHILEFSLARW